MQRTHQLSHMRKYRCDNRCCADSINMTKLLISWYNRSDVSNLLGLNSWRIHLADEIRFADLELWVSYSNVECLHWMSVFFEFFRTNEDLKTRIEYFEQLVDRMTELQKKISDYDAWQIHLLQKFSDSISQTLKQNWWNWHYFETWS